MSTVVTTLMCHAPIVVPAVVGLRGEECAQTTAAMRTAAARVVERNPDVVILLSPHTARRRGFSVAAGLRISGDFGDFGAPAVAIDLPVAVAARARLLASGACDPGVDFAHHPIDHGALVPLHFLLQAGWSGPTVVVALPRSPDTAACEAFGRAIAAASGEERWAVVASGDCSHRLIPGAPSGYSAQARDFDNALAAAIASGDDHAMLRIDPELRALAAEDVVDTVTVAAAASGWSARHRQVLSYEGPYGVGYLVAVLDDSAGDAAVSPGAGDDARVLLDVAKDALRAHLAGEHRRQYFDTDAADALPVSGAFVTWRDGGELRGCVGRMHMNAKLSDVVADLAVQSAEADPRFVPVRAHELPQLAPEVSLLSTPVDVHDVGELDPKVWGVETKLGFRHGVLLPGIDGVDTVEEQLGIVLKKAGIRPDEPFTLRKFRVRKVC